MYPISWSSLYLLNSLYQPRWHHSHAHSRHPDKTIHQYCHYGLLKYLFLFEALSNVIYSNSKFVIHSFFLIILAWSHKDCSVISVTYCSFQILSILLYPLTGFTLFTYRPTQKMTLYCSCIQYFGPCLSFVFVVVNIDIIFI